MAKHEKPTQPNQQLRKPESSFSCHGHLESSYKTWLIIHSCRVLLIWAFCANPSGSVTTRHGVKKFTRPALTCCPRVVRCELINRSCSSLYRQSTTKESRSETSILCGETEHPLTNALAIVTNSPHLSFVERYPGIVFLARLKD